MSRIRNTAFYRPFGKLIITLYLFLPRRRQYGADCRRTDPRAPSASQRVWPLLSARPPPVSALLSKAGGRIYLLSSRGTSTRVADADSHRLNSDPDPAFHFNADPDPAFTLMRIRILSMMMRIWDHWSIDLYFEPSTPPLWASTATFWASKAPEFGL